MAPLGQLEVAGPRYLDKLVHGALFAGASLSLAILAPSLKAPIVGIVALSLGGATELAQAGIGRDASWLDWAADAVGIGIFLLAALILRAHTVKLTGRAADS